MEYLERNLNALVIFILAGVLTSAFGVQFIYHEEPCPLCLLQRLGMIGAATSLSLNLSFGIKPTHYGLALLSALIGASVALRQIALHICFGFSTFGFPVLGLSLYTWSFITSVCIILAISLLLFLFQSPVSEKPLPCNWWSRLASAFLFLVILVNIFTTWQQCGLGPCGD